MPISSRRPYIIILKAKNPFTYFVRKTYPYIYVYIYVKTMCVEPLPIIKKKTVKYLITQTDIFILIDVKTQTQSITYTHTFLSQFKYISI